MQTATLEPMAEGGVWMQPYPGKPAVYVTHEAHVARLLAERVPIVPDPRAGASAHTDPDVAAQQAAQAARAELEALRHEREELARMREEMERERRAMQENAKPAKAGK